MKFPPHRASTSKAFDTEGKPKAWLEGLGVGNTQHMETMGVNTTDEFPVVDFFSQKFSETDMCCMICAVFKAVFSEFNKEFSLFRCSCYSLFHEAREQTGQKMHESMETDQTYRGLAYQKIINHVELTVASKMQMRKYEEIIQEPAASSATNPILVVVFFQENNIFLQRFPCFCNLLGFRSILQVVSKPYSPPLIESLDLHLYCICRIHTIKSQWAN